MTNKHSAPTQTSRPTRPDDILIELNDIATGLMRETSTQTQTDRTKGRLARTKREKMIPIEFSEGELRLSSNPHISGSESDFQSPEVKKQRPILIQVKDADGNV